MGSDVWRLLCCEDKETMSATADRACCAKIWANGDKYRLTSACYILREVVRLDNGRTSRKAV
jgi:hypothetical protein